MSNPIKEYLVSIGLDLNKTKLQQTQKGIKDTTNLIDKMRQASDFLKKGLNGVTLSMLGLAGVSAKLVTSLAKQDQKFETLAQRMFVSRQSVYEYQSAVKALGVTIDEIQFNPTLMKQYKSLVSDSRKMFVGKEYQGAMSTIRSFLFEFVRLKQESMYLLQWIGFSIIKNLQVPLEKARLTLQGLNDFIVKNMSKIGETIGKMIFNVKNFSKSIMDFFGNIIKEIQEFWTSLPPWAKKFIMGTGVIGAIFIGMQNPIVFVSALISGILLLIDDFQKHINNKKSQFGEFWDSLIKWIKDTKKTIYEWKDNSVKWIENFVQICKNKIPELKTLWENVSKWITDNGIKSVNSIVKLIGTIEDFFDRLGFYWGNFKKNPVDFWNKLSTGQLDSEYDTLQLEKKKRERQQQKQTSSSQSEQVFISSNPSSNSNNSKTDKYDSIINAAATKYGVSQNLIKAVIAKETGGQFNADAYNAGSGASGLMQLTPITQKHLGVKDPFNAQENIFAGTKYLKELLARYNGDVKLALIAYNYGPAYADDFYKNGWSDKDLPAETMDYYKSINSYLKNGKYRFNKNAVSSVPASSKITPIRQKAGDTCGVVSVAMANNAINGNNNLNEDNVFSAFGFDLISALNGTNKNKNIKWKDLGNTKITDKEIEEMYKASNQGLPFIFGANGPKFSPSGRGHFMAGQSVDKDKQLITYVDPADGQVKTATFKELKNAALRPDGNAVFIPYQKQIPKAKKQSATNTNSPVFAPISKEQLEEDVKRKELSDRFMMSPEEQKKGFWRYNLQRFQQHLNSLNPFINKNNIKDLQSSTGSYYSNLNSNVYVGGINMTINTNSTNPQVIGNAVADNLQNRINYFALNRGLNLS